MTTRRITVGTNGRMYRVVERPWGKDAGTVYVVDYFCADGGSGVLQGKYASRRDAVDAILTIIEGRPADASSH